MSAGSQIQTVQTLEKTKSSLVYSTIWLASPLSCHWEGKHLLLSTEMDNYILIDFQFPKIQNQPKHIPWNEYRIRFKAAIIHSWLYKSSTSVTFCFSSMISVLLTVHITAATTHILWCWIFDTFLWWVFVHISLGFYGCFFNHFLARACRAQEVNLEIAIS